MHGDAPPLALVVSQDGTHFAEVDIAHLGDAPFGGGGPADGLVGVVDPRVAHLLGTAAAHHVRANRLVEAVTLIVEEAAPPIDDRSAGLEVTSFLASGAIAATLRGFGPRLETWCYRLMEHVMAQHRVPCELRIVHKRAACSPPPAGATCDVILPHRGPDAYLRASVDSLMRQTSPARIQVAIDQEEACTGFLADIADQPRVAACTLAPCPVGPYVARHVLSLSSRAAAIAFQDADDMSVPHRLATLAEAAARSGAGIVGSHELQVHEPHRRVYAIRYPLDVNASLRRAGARHQLLFPTSLVQREVIERVGGFSTFRAFSLDVAFWLSASLTTRIVNVDEFLYVRRRHPTSLTMRADIGTGSDVRRAIIGRRNADFAAILAGRLRLEDSSLAVRHREGPVAFTDLKTGAVTTWP